jgi:hypothetical protein
MERFIVFIYEQLKKDECCRIDELWYWDEYSLAE